MNDENDDYLWDRRGTPDADVARLERVLGALRAQEPPAPLSLPASVAASATPRAAARAEQASLAAAGMGPVRASVEGLSAGGPGGAEASGRWFVLPFAVAATLAVAAASVWLSVYPPGTRASWEVSAVAGSPRIADRALAGGVDRLPVGEWLETDATARAQIKVAGIGRVEVEPRTRVGLVTTGRGDYRMRLDRGTLRALIWATPGQFSVETPAATAIDLGCAYTLQVADDGETVVHVTSGWVALRTQAALAADAVSRTSYVRAGATGPASPRTGPGTPYANDVSEAFKQALRVLDEGRGVGDGRGPRTTQGSAPAVPPASTAGSESAAQSVSGAPAPSFDQAQPARDAAEALDRVIAEARASDAISLWHLLSRVDASARDRVFERLAAFAPPPVGVTREGIRAGDRPMLERWWVGARLGPPLHLR